ncbi:MAG TPA: putative baseplate assembly protein [Rhodoblastus sp.]|nr:putative baseplate assembly protein [Rhodoblastus sp.]
MNVYACCDEKRRAAVQASTLNGVDFLEVVDSDAATPADRQRVLRVHFLKTAPPNLVPANIAIGGGDRITNINVTQVAYDGDVLIVHLDAYGDHSIYRLQLRAATGAPFDPATFDPLFSFIDFSFKVECPSPFDNAAPAAGPGPAPFVPHIDYLARDFASFRQAMFDRLAVIAPQWGERNAADLGVTLVEIFAHVGDLISYRQDAIATEAYIGTARRRTSVRRHARLVDYAMHEGASARAFIHVETGADTTLKQGAQVLTVLPGQAARLAPNSPDLARALALGPEIFETLHDVKLFVAHNSIAFYSWGDSCCRLLKGATSATLKGKLNLVAGDVLIFEEALGPRTGVAADADPARRWAVRLTSVADSTDPLGGAFETPATNAATPVTEIAWGRDDALPFDLQLSANVASNGAIRRIDNVSVARGNIVLADHGASIFNERLGLPPAPSLFRPPLAADPCAPGDPRPIPARFRPQLAGRPLVYAVPYDPANPPASARAALAVRPADAVPRLALSGARDGQPALPWTARADLLASEAAAMDFVVETENDGSAYLRFGDDVHGQRPAPGTVFSASYRIGTTTSGNVAAEAIGHVVSDDPALARVRNPLPAQGGVAPESLENVRRSAPFAFRQQRRAVTLDDYQAAAESHDGVQKAAATFRWTGSWPTAFVSIDRLGGTEVDAAFESDMRAFLEPFRLAGHDVEVNGPHYVPLEIALRATAEADHFRSDVRAALLGVFTAGLTPEGSKGVFHPDNFTFGQPVYLSPLYAAALAIDGVAAVEVVSFQRQGRPDPAALRKGRIDLARMEIARLDNDPDFPERGLFSLVVEGGK